MPNCRSMKYTAERRDEGIVTRSRLSLARTAFLLKTGGVDRAGVTQLLLPETKNDLNPLVEETSWGAAKRVNFPLHIPGCSVHWPYPAMELGSSSAIFKQRV